MNYVIIDGCLQRSSPETKRWTLRVAQTVPTIPITETELAEDYKKIAECNRIIGVHRSDFEKIQDLEETE